MFIKLHGATDNKPIYVNIDHIDSITTGSNDLTSVDTNEDIFNVKETPEEVIEIINQKTNEKLASDTGIITDIIELSVDYTEKKILEYLREVRNETLNL